MCRDRSGLKMWGSKQGVEREECLEKRGERYRKRGVEVSNRSGTIAMKKEKCQSGARGSCTMYRLCICSYGGQKYIHNI